MTRSELIDSWRSGLDGLEVRRIGAWPPAVRAVLLAALFAAALASGHWLTLSGMAGELERLQAAEDALRKERTAKALAASHLTNLRAQSQAVEKAWAAKRLLLPTQRQMPGLLDGIIQAAEANGLSIQGIELQQPHPSGFYAELPMNVTLVGRYHQIGAFLSGVAELPRIVTWHDFELRPERLAEGLRLRIAAKTYTHLGDVE